MTIATSDAPTTADLETSLRTSLATLRKAWPHLEDPTRPAGVRTRSVPGSRLPGNSDALSLRVEIARDMVFWVSALAKDRPEVIGHYEDQDGREVFIVDRTIDTIAVLPALDLLRDHAAWLSGWEHGNRLACELEDHARDARAIAWPKRNDTMLLGPCPNTIGADGTPITCGTPVRANALSPGEVKCRGCGLTDTVDGWILRIVGTEGLVTIPQLVPLLRRRMGLSVSERTLRRWHRDGRIPAAGGTASTPLFDRRTVFAAITVREQLEKAGA